MSVIKKINKVKLVIAYFSSNNQILDTIEKILNKKYKNIDYKSNNIDFLETNYYEKEMGKELKMRFIAFKKLIDRRKLPHIKHYCYKLEKKFLYQKEDNFCRLVNIDPGILSLENFLLATGKNFIHRIYLDRGIWADLTLIYNKKEGFTSLPWTYANYHTSHVKQILKEIRDIYIRALKKKL